MAINLDISDVLIRPIFTEKSNNCLSNRTYSFEVNKLVDKDKVTQAVEKIYNVRVEKVNIMNVKPKPKRRGIAVGKTRSWKKAMVKLVKDYSIPELENLQ